MVEVLISHRFAYLVHFHFLNLPNQNLLVFATNLKRQRSLLLETILDEALFQITLTKITVITLKF